MTTRFDREMASDVAEFLRILPDAAGAGFTAIGAAKPVIEPGPAAADGSRRLKVASKGRELAIDLAPLPARQVGALILPATRVRIGLSGFEDAEATRFMACFDDHYRKGGG